MEKKKIFSVKKVTDFFKRNVYYVMLVLCIAAIGTLITLTAINNLGEERQVISQPEQQEQKTDVEINDDKPADEDIPVVAEPVVFALPVEGTEMKAYCMDTLVFSQTHKQWECHSGIDYVASEGTDVCACFGGTVESVANDLLMGNIVVINHGDGVKTSYANLGTTTVTQGMKVNKGDKIGTIGNSGLMEVSDGNHLHFEATLNGEYVDPSIYFEDENK